MRRSGSLLALVGAVVFVWTLPARAWTSRVNGTLSGDNGTTAVVAGAPGELFAAGFFTTINGFVPAVVKIVGGTERWRWTYSAGADGDGFAIDVLLGTDGNPIVVANLAVPGHDQDWVIAKLAADTGAEIWRRVIDGGGHGFDAVRGAAIDSQGDVVVVGSLANAPGTLFDAGIGRFAAMKLSRVDGVELWTAVFPATPGAFDEATAVAVDADVYVAGNIGGMAIVLRLAMADGQGVWGAPVGGGVANAIAVDPSSGAVNVAGHFYDDPDAGPDFTVIGLDAGGGFVWTYKTGGSSVGGFDEALDVAPTNDGSGDVIATGVLSNSATGNDAFIVRINGTDGGPVWMQTVDAPEHGADRGTALVVSGADVVVGGEYGNTTPAATSAFELDVATGMVKWTRAYGVSGFGAGTRTTVALDGTPDPIVGGRVDEGVLGGQLFVAKVSGADGTEVFRFGARGDGFKSDDVGHAIARAPDGDVVVAGSTQNAVVDVFQHDDFTVAKLDGRRGTERWRYTLEDGVARRVAVDTGGDVVAVGALPGAQFDTDLAVVKLAADGHELWRRQFAGLLPPPGGGHDRADALALGPDDAILVAGAVENTGTLADAFVAKLAPDGTELWRRVFDAPGADEARAIAVDAAGDVVVGGDTGDPDGDWLLAKLAGADGAVRWSTIVHGLTDGESSLYDLAVDPSTGNVVATGSLTNARGTTYLGVVRFAAADGQELWRATFQGSFEGYDVGRSVAIDAAGNVIATGLLYNQTSFFDVFVAKLAPDKTTLWTRTVSGAQDGFDFQDESTDLALDASGNPIVVGYLDRDTSFFGFAADLFALALDTSSGNELWRHVVPGVEASPSSSDARPVLSADSGGIAILGTKRFAGASLDLTTTRVATDGTDAACVKVFAADPECRPCSAGCDDTEPCTSDSCDATSFCAWTQVSGDAAVTCGFDRTLPPAACAGDRVPRGIAKTYKRAGKAVDHALRAKSSRKMQKLFRRGSRLLGRVLEVIDKAARRRRRPLSASCAEALRALAQDTKARVDARLGPP